MLLSNHKGTAFHPFPCPVCLVKRTRLDKDGQTPVPYNAIMCGESANFLIAAYHDLVPAKMELSRLKSAFEGGEEKVFTFMRDPYEENDG